ncbi:MAG TPA: hypothetical protein VGI45_29870 [Terracidiphilus sp.]|jgi:hypothetical protein
MVKTADCPGFRVRGKAGWSGENPAPETESAKMVTAAVPVDVTVTGFETGVPKATVPNATGLGLRLRAATVGGDNVMLNVAIIPLAWAVIVAVWGVVKELTVALKPVLLAPPLTVIADGTVTAGLLLLRDMLNLLLVVAVR